jgi:hypothetical protein
VLHFLRRIPGSVAPQLSFRRDQSAIAPGGREERNAGHGDSLLVA